MRPAGEGGGGSGLGMDPGLGRQQAAQLDEQSKKIKTAQADIDGLMNELRAVWIGDDQKRFDTKWQSEYSSQLKDAAKRLHKAAEQVRTDAAEQGKTSK
jgi:uncharacterized protein YukE